MPRFPRQWPHRAIGAAMLLLAIGCTAFRTKIVETDPNGDVAECKHLKGVPMTLTVPTHVEIVINRSRYAVIPDSADLTKTVALKYGTTLYDTYDVDYRFFRRKQLHTVDFKRPFSGKLKTAITFNQDTQNITKVDNSITDNTIADVSGLITTALTKAPLLGIGRPTSVGAVPNASDTFQFTDVVAVEIFDVHDPELEAKIQEFLNHHLNACAAKCPPGTTCPAPVHP